MTPFPPEHTLDPKDDFRRVQLWQQWRASVLETLCIGNSASKFGDLERRNALFQSYSEKTARKYSLRAKLEIAEQHWTSPDTVNAVWDPLTETNPLMQQLRN